MEQQSTGESASRVRCLDCGTFYEQPSEQTHSAVCPNCGYVGWIAVNSDAAADAPNDT